MRMPQSPYRMPTILEQKVFAKDKLTRSSYNRNNLNRSLLWPYAETYAEARELSPPSKPVR